ncbi:sirohydrochlorin cobaltochelatase, partial [Paratractidigestivibacter sp.]
MDNKVSRRNFIAGAAAVAATALAGCSASNSSSSTTTETGAAEVKPVILVTSFGTSYNDSRHITIGAIEDAIREKYGQDYDVRRAFTAQIIIDKLKSRDGITIDNVTEALDRCVADGVKKVLVQPTHLMAGLEYADVKDELEKYADKFDKVVLGEPLLSSDGDYDKVADAIGAAMADYEGSAICLMGHGTEADSNQDYTTMQEKFTAKGMTNYFVGTVEASPTCADVIAAAQAAGYTKAVLAPFMVVAGDHANNDMADLEDPESWASQFTAAGFEVKCVLAGLGQYDTIDDIYVQH